MTSQTSMAAEQVRLKQWADMISDCQNRPSGMKVEDWCRQNGLTKADYYYRLRRVRKACIDAYESSGTSFVEVSVIPDKAESIHTGQKTMAVIRHGSGISVELQEGISRDSLKNIIEVPAHVQ